MKVSLNWVKQFTDVSVPVTELADKIGRQLGEIESVTDLGQKYQGIIIARIISCEKHSNADKLSVCWIDDGNVSKDVERDERGYVQVVCGAPNVREGLMVAWLPPGSTVPSTFDKDPFVLGSRELRGIVSNGMLASASELAISDDHDGIVEIDVDVAPGTSFAEAYQLDDTIIDIENKMFTHRPDCFGILGVAREIAGIQHIPFTSPNWYTSPLGRIKAGKEQLNLSVSNNVPELVPRMTAIAMTNIGVKPSPLTLQVMLSRVGLRPINNIVDITNYLMYLTGQPLHAYDADKLQSYGELSIEVRMSKNGDKLKLLNGKEVEIRDDTTVLITSNDTPIGIAGVMGGADTEVDGSTKNVVIECANFDMYSVRRTSMKYGLFTDAVTRFNKGQSSLQNERVIEEAVALVQSLAHGQVASELIDIQVNENQPPTVVVDADFINSRLGSQIAPQEMSSLLQNVEFTVNLHGDKLSITPPFWRTDVEIPEDIVEEVGRLYGYESLPASLPMRNSRAINPNSELEAKKNLRQALSRAGASEALTYSFVHGKLFEKVSQNKDIAFKLGNAISPELEYYRLSLTPSLLEKVHPNLKSGYNEFALFEIGKVHSKTEMEDGLPKEFDRLAFVYAMEEKNAIQQAPGAPYYMAKYYLETVYGNGLRYQPLTQHSMTEHQLFMQLAAPFEPLRSALVFSDDTLLGIVGEYKLSVKKALKLPEYCSGFEGFISPLLRVLKTKTYVPVSRFPKIEQDITLRVPKDHSYQTVLSCLEENLSVPPDALARLSPLDIFKKSSDDTHVQMSFRLTISSYDRTLKSDEVNNLLDEASAKCSDLIQTQRV